MQELVHADIFFFITSFAVLVFTLGMGILFYYLIQIARDVRALITKVKKAGDEIEQDFEALRANLREEGTKGKLLVDLVLTFISTKLKKFTFSRVKKKQSSSEE